MSENIKVTEIFGEDVFNDSVMQQRLPKKVYKELKQTILEGKELSLEMADVIAHEMKEVQHIIHIGSAAYRSNSRET